MGRVKVCVGILLGLVLVAIITLSIISSRCDALTNQVMAIGVLTERKEMAAALEQVDALDRSWEGDYKLLSCLVRHEKLADINASLAKLKPLIENGNDEVSAEVSSILFQISLLKETEFPYLYNLL